MKITIIDVAILKEKNVLTVTHKQDLPGLVVKAFQKPAEYSSRRLGDAAPNLGVSFTLRAN